MFYSAEVDILLNFILVSNLEDDQLVKKMAITFATTAPAREVVSRILHVKLTMHRDKLGIFFFLIQLLVHAMSLSQPSF